LGNKFLTSCFYFKDQIEHLVKRKIVAETINSKLSVEDRKRVTNDLRTKCPNTQILYITPEQAATAGFQVFISQLTLL
jgi:ATP-dependent DNA helicase Q5